MPAAAIDLLRLRLRNQQLSRSDLRTPAAVVSWLGAVQAQDYTGATWALGLRAHGITEADVDRAFTDGAILRTHVMRPTWHFVAPADIRWMQALTGPHVLRRNAPMHTRLELDDRLLTRSRTALERALEGGAQLTRTELAAALLRARIPAEGMRLAYIVMHAELEGAICSGARRGKQFTYALLDERVPRARAGAGAGASGSARASGSGSPTGNASGSGSGSALTRDEALAELTRRYFASHGPATVKDFVWWSGLGVRDAKAGLALIAPDVQQDTIGDLTYWSIPSTSPVPPAAPTAHLLPNYDEYGIAYRDRGHFAALPPPAGDATGHTFDPYGHLLVIDGRLAGSWRRTLDTNRVLVNVVLHRTLTPTSRRTLNAAAERFRKFLNVPVTLSSVAADASR